MKSALFDLDGTLTDSGEGIRNGVQYVLNYYGIQEPDPENLNRLIGPPLPETIRTLYGIEEPEDTVIENKFREYYTDKGIFENRVYNGIPEALNGLREKGFSLFVATSKPQFMAEKVLSHFHLSDFFDGIVGATRDLQLVKKDDIIRELLTRYNLLPQNTLMVGDRKYDMIGANRCGVLPIGAAWGYGSITELLSANAMFILDEPSQMPDFLGRLAF